MKRFLLELSALFLLMSGSAFANSVTTTIGLSPNNGSGDNFGFLQTGRGFVIGIQGGTPADFFNDGPYAPGTTVGGDTDVFFSSAFVELGGRFHDLDFFGPGALFLSPFTLPTTGKDFTAHVFVFFSADGFIPTLAKA
jgi:hypothetical protein